MLSIRKIGVIGRTYRHLKRYRQIMVVLFRYGFGNFLEALKIDQYIEMGLQAISRKRRERLERLTKMERVRMVFEELGPTFVKLGQIISTRPDIVPIDLVEELAKLQDMVPPFSFDEAKTIIESELGAPLEQFFDSFDEIPIASASIGQVHKAVLKDGEKVAVKVQRPNIKKVIEIDIEIMLHIATLMERHIEEMELQRPVKVVEEFARTIEKEINYTIEAVNMERFARNFLGDFTNYVPKVFQKFTTVRVLTMEYIEGIKISQIGKLKKAGLDKKLVNARGANIFLKQVFNHGFFHADPHPGNIFVLPNNVLCFLDFGMMGSVNKTSREDFVDLIDGAAHQDESKAAQALLKLTIWDDEPDIRQLELELSDFMGRHLYKSLKHIEIGKLLQNILEITSHHSLRIPPNIFLMLKAFSTIEGIGLMLDPSFDMVSQSKPFIKRVKLARFHPKRVAENFAKSMSELLHFTQQFPKDMLKITRMISQQKLSVRFEHHGLENMLKTHDQISNRISFSIVIASLIIGSALIVFAKIPPLFHGISLIGIIGFLSAAIMGIWLLIAILKKGKL